MKSEWEIRVGKVIISVTLLLLVMMAFGAVRDRVNSQKTNIIQGR